MSHIYLGNCREILKNIASQSVDLVFTSPPYDDQMKSKYPPRSPDDISLDMREVKRVLREKGSLLMVVRSPRTKLGVTGFVDELHNFMMADGWKHPEDLFWYKADAPVTGDNTSETRMFTRKMELILWYSKENPHFDVYAGGHWTTRSGPQRHQKKGDMKIKISQMTDTAVVSVGRNKSPGGYNHPTPFPVALAEWWIRPFTKGLPHKPVVLDPYCGTGPTLEAADNLHCDWIGIEIVEKYYQQALRRMTDPRDRPIRFRQEFCKDGEYTKTVMRAYLKHRFGYDANENRRNVWFYIISQTIESGFLSVRLSLNTISTATGIQKKTVQNCLDWLKDPKVNLIIREEDSQSHKGIASLTGVHPDLLET